ncbi:MAG: N-acetylmuramoyl-L-alanine amidase, partial [Cupriavidus necator]
GRAAGTIGGLFSGASRIIDLTASADKRLRKGTRKPGDVYALVLHQMGCCFAPKDPLKRFLTLNAHFAILPDGRILQLHPLTALLWASNGFNKGSVAVEFAGNFPSTRGRWWQGDKFGRNQVTAAQIEAGRYLVRYLQRTMNLRVVLAHRQSSGSRENDPGPDIWSQVGQWAVETLGLSDGGAGFKVGSGNAIPQVWREWGRAGVVREFGSVGKGGVRRVTVPPRTAALRRTPSQCNGNGRWSVPVPLEAGPRLACAQNPGVYFVYKDDKPLYVGKAESSLQQRLNQHIWCLKHLGISRAKLFVKVMPLPDTKPEDIKAKESALIAQYGRRKDGGVLTNIMPELETPFISEA